jgi:hypothetical protein
MPFALGIVAATESGLMMRSPAVLEHAKVRGDEPPVSPAPQVRASEPTVCGATNPSILTCFCHALSPFWLYIVACDTCALCAMWVGTQARSSNGTRREGPQ